MTEGTPQAPVILFVATSGPHDISIARREPDGTLRRATYANVNWMDRLSADGPALVSLLPHTDLRIFNLRMNEMLGRDYEPDSVLDLSNYVAGFFTAMKHYHGSDWSGSISGVGFDLPELSNAIGVPVQSYDPDKNSTNRLNWTLRLWERTQL